MVKSAIALVWVLVHRPSARVNPYSSIDLWSWQRGAKSTGESLLWEESLEKISPTQLCLSVSFLPPKSAHILIWQCISILIFSSPLSPELQHSWTPKNFPLAFLLPWKGWELKRGMAGGPSHEKRQDRHGTGANSSREHYAGKNCHAQSWGGIQVVSPFFHRYYSDRHLGSFLHLQIGTTVITRACSCSHWSCSQPHHSFQ